MAKKALISKIEPRGQNDSGYRVAEVVDVGQEFEVHAPDLYWADCEDSIQQDINYWDPTTSSYLLEPMYVPYPDTTLPEDEQWVWNYSSQQWEAQPI